MWKKRLIGGLIVLGCVSAAVLSYGPLHAWQAKGSLAKDTPIPEPKAKNEFTNNCIPPARERTPPAAPALKPPKSEYPRSPASAASAPPSPNPPQTTGSQFLPFGSAQNVPPRSDDKAKPDAPRPPSPQDDPLVGTISQVKSAPTLSDLLNRLKKIKEERVALDKEEKDIAARVKAELLKEQQKLLDQRQKLNDMEGELVSLVPHLFPKHEGPKPASPESQLVPVGACPPPAPQPGGKPGEGMDKRAVPAPPRR